MFTQEQLKKAYDYNKETGQLTRRSKNRRKQPSEGTSLYSNVSIKGKSIREHRAIWIWHNGTIPEGMMLDHIDGNTHNNRIENLRLCTPSNNAMNRRIVNKRTGYKGVVIVSPGTYLAQIMNAGKLTALGRFTCPKQAARAYDAAALLYFKEFARTNADMGLV